MSETWKDQLFQALAAAEEAIRAVLGSFGQDNELLALGLLILLSLLIVAGLWALLLMLVRSIMGVLAGDSDEPAEGGATHRVSPRLSTPAMNVPERARLDVVPSSATPLQQRATAADEPLAMARGPAVSGDDGLPLRKVSLSEMPKPSPLRASMGGSSEFGSSAAPGAWSTAEAAEITRVSLGGERGSTRGAQSYRIAALPWVDASGERRPDLFVYSLSPGATKQRPPR